MQGLRDMVAAVRHLGETPEAAKLRALLDQQGRLTADAYQKWSNLALSVIAQVAKAGYIRDNISNN